jgi:hypothetical protein
LTLAGCGPAPTPDAEAPALRERIAALEAELAETRTAQSNRLARAAAELEAEHQRRYDDMESTLRRQVFDLTQTIRQLREDLDTARTIAPPPDTAPPPPPPPVDATAAAPADTPAGAAVISEYRPTPPSRDEFLDPPEGPDADLFPVAVEAVRGATQVVGTHMSTRMVETGETIKDAFGQEKPVMRQEQYEVEDYAYRVTFQIHNRTRSPQEVRYQCGQESRTVRLAPGESQACTVGALVGAPLRLQIGNAIRQFPVTQSPQPPPTP